MDAPVLRVSPAKAMNGAVATSVDGMDWSRARLGLMCGLVFKAVVRNGLDRCC